MTRIINTNYKFISVCDPDYNDVIMATKASQITNLAIFYSTVYSGADQRKHQSSASLAFVGGIHLWPVNSPHKWPVTRKMLPFDDVIMYKLLYKLLRPFHTRNSSSKISFVHNIQIGCRIDLQFCMNTSIALPCSVQTLQTFWKQQNQE